MFNVPNEYIVGRNKFKDRISSLIKCEGFNRLTTDYNRFSNIYLDGKVGVKLLFSPLFDSKKVDVEEGEIVINLYGDFQKNKFVLGGVDSKNYIEGCTKVSLGDKVKDLGRPDVLDCKSQYLSSDVKLRLCLDASDLQIGLEELLGNKNDIFRMFQGESYYLIQALAMIDYNVNQWRIHRAFVKNLKKLSN